MPKPYKTPEGERGSPGILGMAEVVGGEARGVLYRSSVQIRGIQGDYVVSV